MLGRVRGIFVTSIMVALLLGVATAGTPKPTAAQAKKTAEAWLADISAAAPLTMLPLWSIAKDDSSDGECGEAISKTAAELTKRLVCLAKVVNGDELVPWTKKAAKKLPYPLKSSKSKIAKLEQTATLVHKHEECAGQGGDIIVAVALDKDTPKVVAVLYQTFFCGE
jgi:hypothetical protein